MTNTKRFMNWTTVTFTPSGGSLFTYTGVKSVKIDDGGSLLKFAGDGDRFNTLVINDFNEPTAEVSLADLATLNTNRVGTIGVFAATHNDAVNKAVSGSYAITYSLANAVIANQDRGGEHRQIGMGTVKFEHQSTDGSTWPITFTVL